MAYRDDIIGLGANHLFPFDGDATDLVGNLSTTPVGITYGGPSICEDASQSLLISSVTNRLTLDATPNIEDANQRFAVAGWFMVDSIQLPPKSMYADGGSLNSMKIIFGFGNNLMLEVLSSSAQNPFLVQVYGPILQPNRIYHICAVFEGPAYGNEARLYVDGVKYTQASPVGGAPNDVLAAGRDTGVFGVPITSEIGNDSVVQNAAVDSRLGFWAFWGNNSSAALTDQQVRRDLFEKGAPPSITIESNTQESMQATLNTLANTVRPDQPLNIRVEPVLGGGDFQLVADNIRHDALASTHLQYTGTDTLTWINDNGSNTSIVSVPNLGAVDIITPATLTISSLIPDTEIRILVSGTTDEIVGVESSGTSFQVMLQASVVDVVIHKEDYENLFIKNVSMMDGNVELSIDQIFDRQYGSG